MNRGDWVNRTANLQGCPNTPCAGCDPLSTFFATTDPGCEAVDDHIRYYAGTLFLGIPSCARGTYTMPFDLGFDTFFSDQQNPAQNIPVAQFISGKLTIPVGRCCYALGGQQDCADNVTEGECNELPAPRIFVPDEICGDVCCSKDQQCNDDNICTSDHCASGQCEFNVNPLACDDGTFCNGAETCANGECFSGPAPCSGSFCDEAGNDCFTPIPTVSHWGLAVIALAMLILGKLYMSGQPQPDPQK